MNLIEYKNIKEKIGTGLMIAAGLLGLYLFYPVIEAAITVVALGGIGYLAYTRRDCIREKIQEYIGKNGSI
jgi:hypothetical protein